MDVTSKQILSTKGNLAAAIHHPDRGTDKLAILCPGYLDSKDYKHLVELAKVLSEQGYAAVRFDPTGTWESDGDINDYTTTQYLEDIRTVLAYMLKQGNYNHILLGGHSRGGQVSILYGAREPRVSLVLGIMPSSNRTLVGRRYDEWRKSGVSIEQRDLPDDESQHREYRVPYSHVEDRRKYDVAEDVKKIKSPIILLAGEKDHLVLPEDVREIFNNANEPKRFIIIPGIGHDYRSHEDEVAMVNEKILQLIESVKP